MAGFSARISLISGCFGLLLTAIPMLVQADVTLKEKTSVEGAGMMRMANMSGTTTTVISGNNARMESDLQMDSRMVRMLARGMGPSAEILLLDQDKALTLNLKKKEYSEASLTARRAQLEQATAQAQKAQQPAAGAGVDESQCEWSEPKAEVKRTGQMQSFAGFDSERVSVTASQSCRDKKTGSVCDFAVLLDQWIAPNFQGGEEQQRFYTAYAQQMGLDPSASHGAAERAGALLGRYEGVWGQVVAKMKDIKGAPVKSSFAFAVGGPQCQSSGPAAASSSSSTAESPGGIAGKIAGSLFNRNKKAETGAPSAEATLINGMVPMLTVHSELLSVSNAPAAAGTFEAPADFKKVAASN